MADDDLTDEQIRQMERKLLGLNKSKPIAVELRKPRRPRPPRSIASPKPPAPSPKEFVEIISAGTSYHFMHVLGPDERKHLKSIEEYDEANAAAQEFVKQGLRVIWK
ncbi:hypothetical protein [Ensifer aridi]|uniref:hypothetical protein n=1 Tax=Ensifer aridi TaxID=1708715 RepID=UPI00358EBF57